eukprot:11170113-Alexandrium_andersonii.AAC.1
MSASLVGSEMCIRDRRQTALAVALNPRKSEPARLSARRRRYHALRGTSCLLYTSDAADDM